MMEVTTVASLCNNLRFSTCHDMVNCFLFKKKDGLYEFAVKPSSSTRKEARPSTHSFDA